MTASIAVRERTPDRPGPGPLPEALLRALDLKVGRRIEGLLAGGRGRQQTDEEDGQAQRGRGKADGVRHEATPGMAVARNRWSGPPPDDAAGAAVSAAA